MGWIVVTTEGQPSHYERGEDKVSKWDKDRAIARADEANRRAEAMGLKVRYEPKEEK